MQTLRPGCGPSWLAAAGPEAVALRAELTRRAPPVRAGRLPGPAGPAPAVRQGAGLVGRGRVVVAPGAAGRAAGQGQRRFLGRAPAAAGPAAAADGGAEPAERADGPVPTLEQAPVGSAGPAPRRRPPRPPSTAVAADADSGAALAGNPGGVDPGSAGRTDRPPVSGRRLDRADLARPRAGSCGDDLVRARCTRPPAASQVSRVIAVASRTESTVALQPDGDGWSGTLTGLPTSGTLTVAVFADGAVRPGTARLRASTPAAASRAEREPAAATAVPTAAVAPGSGPGPSAPRRTGRPRPATARTRR